MKFDNAFITRVKKEIPMRNPQELRNARKIIRRTAKVLNENGRLEEMVEMSISECGYIPVILTLAASIIKYPEDYDDDVLQLAKSIPGASKLEALCDFNTYYLQNTFIIQTRPNWI